MPFPWGSLLTTYSRTLRWTHSEHLYPPLLRGILTSTRYIYEVLNKRYLTKRIKRWKRGRKRGGQAKTAHTPVACWHFPPFLMGRNERLRKRNRKANVRDVVERNEHGEGVTTWCSPQLSEKLVLFMCTFLKISKMPQNGDDIPERRGVWKGWGGRHSEVVLYVGKSPSMCRLSFLVHEDIKQDDLWGPLWLSRSESLQDEGGSETYLSGWHCL